MSMTACWSVTLVNVINDRCPRDSIIIMDEGDIIPSSPTEDRIIKHNIEYDCACNFNSIPEDIQKLCILAGYGDG